MARLGGVKKQEEAVNRENEISGCDFHAARLNVNVES